MNGAERILEERERNKRRYGHDHDKQHHRGELALAAAELAVLGTEHVVQSTRTGMWCRDRWGLCAKHNEDRIRQLEIAGALIAAEIDRLLADS